MKSNDNEIWKDIKNYEGKYKISSLSNVISLERKAKGNTKQKERKVNYKILKPYLNNNGYLYYNLTNDHKTKHIYLHRLLAEAFIPNPNNYPCINHIDGNKLNNSLENLEWCTYSHNNREAYRIGLKIGSSIGKYGYDNWKSKIIYQYDKQGNFIQEWANARVASEKLNICYSCISACCRNEQKSSGGYIWRYKKEVMVNE